MTTTPDWYEPYGHPWSKPVLVPSPATLAKYGLSRDEWTEIFKRQHGGCGVCGNVPESGRLVIDHEHVRGWKVMPPEQRKLYVRGLTCWYCNHAYLGRGINIDKAQGVVDYLTAYAARRP